MFALMPELLMSVNFKMLKDVTHFGSKINKRIASTLGQRMDTRRQHTTLHPHLQSPKSIDSTILRFLQDSLLDDRTYAIFRFSGLESEISPCFLSSSIAILLTRLGVCRVLFTREEVAGHELHPTRLCSCDEFLLSVLVSCDRKSSVGLMKVGQLSGPVEWTL